MRCVKTVTPIKMDANRKNAKRSTGPRTHRGKSIAKFNAVTHGLFAKHVAIPICDGDNPERDFQSLLDRLHQDFQPKGFYEEWLVGKIAECMWRLRRAARCESGAVREAAMRDCRDVDTEVVMRFAGELSVLGQAAQQPRDSGTLSRKIYRQIVPLMEEGDRSSLQSEEENEPIETDFDRDLLMSRITDRMQFILCPMNRGSLGVRELNTALQKVLNPARPGQSFIERFGWRFQIGDKVIQTENDYDKDVFNGDVGIVERIDAVRAAGRGALR